MKLKKLASCHLVLFLLIGLISPHPAASAGETLINFDDVADGTVVNTHYPSVTFTNPIGGNIYGRNGSGFAPSSANVASVFATGLPYFDARFGAVDAHFSTPVRAVKIDARPVAPFEFLTALTKRPFLQAFDSANNLLGTVYYAGPLPTTVAGVGPTETLTFTSPSGANNIAYARFSSQTPGSGPATYGLFDNLRFDNGFYTLTVNIVGSGIVSTTPLGPYPYGSVVTLGATPSANWTFTGWSGSFNSTANPVLPIMDADKTVTATFVPTPQAGPNFVVNTTDDHDDGVAGVLDCTLREAINAANANADANTITFASTVTGVITLQLGELIINRDLTIIGPGVNVLGIVVNNISSVSRIDGGAVVAISGLSIRNVVVGFNAFNGINVFGGSSLSLTACHISGFRSTGIVISGALSLNYCTVSGNSGDRGGGIFNGGTLAVTNSTLSGNSAGSGGGIYNQGTVTLQSSTICSNTIYGSFGGGGVRNNSGTVNVRNCIIAANTNASAVIGPDCVGSFASLGYNLVGKTNDSSGFGDSSQDQAGSIALPINPLLGPLADNGGPTFTHSLLVGSPAIDQGHSFGLTTDQRGRSRPYDFPAIANFFKGDGSDIGAFELFLPLLKIFQSKSSLVLSWPINEAGFTLQFATELASPMKWRTARVEPEIIDGEYQVKVETTDGNLFYRLSVP